MNRFFLFLLLVLLPVLSYGQKVTLPDAPDSLHFAVLGDNGTGRPPQYETARTLTAARAQFPFDIVLMMGDNLYGGEDPDDFVRKFSEPYKALLDDGVKFYASLGNHDKADERFYKAFNMNGQRYYTFSPKKGVRFFALDSNYMDKRQVEWLEKELRNSHDAWKICFFHHPLYSTGSTHGSSKELRFILEPLFVRYGVDVVFSGHEHFYERIEPQRGIYYFISGAGGQLRRGDIQRREPMAKGFDEDNSFLLLDITGDKMYFQAISRTGITVDAGTIERRKEEPEKQTTFLSVLGSQLRAALP